jgi:hypothetical protein
MRWLALAVCERPARACCLLPLALRLGFAVGFSLREGMGEIGFIPRGDAQLLSIRAMCGCSSGVDVGQDYR